MIFRHLSQNDLPSLLDLRNISVFRAKLRAHGNMRSLCLTSKRVDCIARPLLFQNITIFSPANLVPLYRTLQESAHLRSHVRQVSLDIMAKAMALDDLINLQFSASTGLRVGFDDKPMITREFCGFGLLLPNLGTLKLSIPMDDGVNGYQALGWYVRHGMYDLRRALAQMTNLRTLVLEVYYTVTTGEITNMPLQGLNLTSLRKLETAKVPLPMLLNATWDHSAMVHRIKNAVPQYLKRLIFTIEVPCVSHWFQKGDAYSGFHMHCTSASTIIEFLGVLSRIGHEVFPHLEEVVCCYSMKGFKDWPVCEDVEISSTGLEEADLFALDDTSSQRLEQLRTSVRLQKIRFGVAYEGLFCNCQSVDGIWA